MFSRFFVELSAVTPLGGLPPLDKLDAISTKYGMTRLGPPMSE